MRELNDLIPLNLPPGITRRGTEYQTRGRWRDANLVRFEGTSVVPFLGWESIALDPLVTVAGIARSSHSWTDNEGNRFMAIGTSQGLYVFDAALNLTDITPPTFTPGPDAPGAPWGFGSGEYGVDVYENTIPPPGTPTTDVGLVYGYWHLDNFGENLVASHDSDGVIYQWAPGDATALPIVAAGTPVGNAMPTRVKGILVTNERHMMAFAAERTVGVSEPRRVQWSDQEDNTTWKADPLNAAGEQDLNTAGAFVRAFRFKEETLVFTSTDLHRMRYVGYPDVYVPERIAGDCGLLCPMAVSKSADQVVWLSPRGLFVYDGQSVRPVISEVSEDIEGQAMRHIVATRTAFVAHNDRANEFLIFYPGLDSNEPSRFLQWNYLAGWWSIGVLHRTLWTDSMLFSQPLAAAIAAASGIGASAIRFYRHEIGFSRADYPLAPYITSGPVELGNGHAFIAVDTLMLDVEGDRGALAATFGFIHAPQGPTIKTVGPLALGDARGYLTLRGSGRSMTIHVGQTRDPLVGGWRIGTCRFGGAVGEQR